jgi:hypothetical protein
MSFTVRHVDRTAGEISTQHDNRLTAAFAYALELPSCLFAELRDNRTGRILATYRPEIGSIWHPAEGSTP